MGCRRPLIGAVSPNANANAAAARQSPIIVWSTEKRRNVLLIFAADNAQPNIGWPSIVQHLASFHPAVIHHNSTASTSRHVITPALPLLRQTATYFLASDHGRTTYPFVSTIRNTIHYLCTLTPPLTSTHPPLAAFAGL
jgi:hypothetical protein